MRSILAILGSTVWISINEFLRNQIVLLDHWTSHYAAKGLTFPVEPLNGAVWGLWALAFSAVIFFLTERFQLVSAAALAWSIGFVLMWLVIGNLGVLPLGILPVAVPWSIVEAFGAVWVVRKVSPSSAQH